MIFESERRILLLSFVRRPTRAQMPPASLPAATLQSRSYSDSLKLLTKTAAHEAEKRAKSAEWQLEDVRRLKNAEIEELQKDKGEMVNVKQGLLDEYEGKMSQLLASLHAVERAFAQQKETYEAQISDMDKARKDEVEKATKALEDVSEKLSKSEEKIATITSEFKRAKNEYEGQIADQVRRTQEAKQSAEQSAALSEAHTEDAQVRIVELEEEVTRARKDVLDAQADADRARVEASNLQKELKIKVEAYEARLIEAAERDVQRESEWAEREAELIKTHDERVACLQHPARSAAQRASGR